ncbi:hypothetical protein BVC80_9087g22 [Macleaya cordata]|uniref:Epidermal patterning factor-like protein n=1 Tax=Macleaya cordata TaxID=56857 RepID=A0A200PQQ0_MACCD|nr:hypothetical protein BVC80_9087g22 [Macleaya cordata]
MVVFTILLLIAPSIMSARGVGRPHHSHHHHLTRPRMKDGEMVRPELYARKRTPMRPRGPDTLQIAGSSLPDCSHACGSCSPCRLVMVSFVCASLEEAETCPMAYKCMCNSKSYPVP